MRMKYCVVPEKQVWYLSFLTPLLEKYTYSVIQLCSKRTAKDMAFNPNTLKLKNRDCAYKLKYGLPKLREVLRQKCRDKMRERRHQLFNEHRSNLEDEPKNMQDTLMNIVREEFKSLTTLDNNMHLKFTYHINEPLNQEEAIELENQIICEQEQWILQEYEKILQDEVEYLSTYADNKDVFCPLCQKTLLIQENNSVCCKFCKLELNNRKLEEVGYLINESVNVHAFNCNDSPVFTIISDGNVNLYLICNSCSTLALIC